MCKECGVIDDVNHRMNYCKRWQRVNLYNEVNKISINNIYSDNEEEVMTIVKMILSMWDLGNGKNEMRSS